MFLDNYFEKNEKLKSLAKESGTFSGAYKYWKDALFERALHLFHWDGTYEVPEHEIEIALMLNGTCGVTAKYKGKLSVFNGYYAGDPTQYFDIYKKYSVYSPVFSGTFEIDKDIAVGKNNSLGNGIYPLIHRYAIMLAHTEVSLVNTLINGRDSGGIPIASTQAQKTAIEDYRNSLCNGKVTSILDPAFSGVEFVSVSKNTVLNIKELMEVRQNLLSSFYADLGIKTAHEKKGNMIQEEVEANDSMLMLNLSDMLEFRQRLCEDVNAMYGTNWSVELAPELKYFEEVGNDGISNETEENIEQ